MIEGSYEYEIIVFRSFFSGEGMCNGDGEERRGEEVRGDGSVGGEL